MPPQFLTSRGATIDEKHQSTTEHATRTTLLSSYRVVSFVLGIALLLAGALTSYDTLDSSRGFGAMPWLSVLGGGAEIAFGLWLMVGLYPLLSWWLAVACFITFLAVSFDRAIAGQSSCGCFGRLHFPPWYTFAFDAVAILALSWAQPFPLQRLDTRTTSRRWIIYACLLFLMLAGLGATTLSSKPYLSEEGEIIGQGQEVFLSPHDWVGHRFPLSRHIDVGPGLMQGRWAVMFYHPDCSICRTAIPEFVALGYHLGSQERSTRVALIEVPREGFPLSGPSRDGICLRGKLSEEHPWRIRTPSFVLLDDAMVTKVPDELTGVYHELGIRGGEEEISGASPFPDYRRIRRELFLRQIACGPLALIKVLDAFGTQLTEEQAEQLINEAGDKGIDMLRLKQLAEHYGLYALGVAVSPEKLREMGERAIVYIDSAGFIPVLGYTKGGVIVAYPLAAPGVLPDDLFAKSFGAEGKALLISDKPLNPAPMGLSTAEQEKPKGPRLTPARTVIAVGRLHRKNFEASLRLTNDGSERLEIKDIKTTCPCFTATVDRNTLAPGESTELRASGTQDNLGPFNYAVVIETNEIEGSPVRVPVRGYLEPLVAFNPPAAFLRDLLPGQEAQSEVEVELPRGTKFSTLKLDGPKEPRLIAELLQRKEGAALKLRWVGAGVPQIYRGELQVRPSDAKDAVAAILPWAVEVIPLMTVFPPSLCIEQRTGELWMRRLNLDSKQDFLGDPLLRWSDEGAGKMVKSELTRDGRRSIRLTLSGKVAHPPKQMKLTLVIGEQCVSIPIRFEESGY